MSWHLDDRIDTTLGTVACGRAGDGPALVLGHGWPWSSFAWHRVIPHLAPHFTVHWYDMPGFGHSDRALERDTGIGAQGRVLCEMLDHWGLDRPAVWAHDFGGAVSLRAALLHGRAYDRLLLMNVVAMRPWGSDFFAHVGRHLDAFTGLPAHIHKAVVCAYIDSALVRPLDPGDYDALDAPWLDAGGQTAFYRQFEQADEALTAEFEPRLGDVAFPVRVLWGDKDPWIPAQRGRALAQAIGVPFEALAGLGHLPQLENPEGVADRALAFLRGGD